MADITLICVTSERHTGTTKPKDGQEGRKYDFYSGLFKDPLSGIAGKFTCPVIDGKHPPEVGQEYPVQFDVYAARDYSLVFRAKLDPTYVS